MDLPLSPEAKRILIHAAEEAERMNLRAIGTEHLLLALLREENTLAARILYEHGLRPQPFGKKSYARWRLRQLQHLPGAARKKLLAWPNTVVI